MNTHNIQFAEHIIEEIAARGWSEDDLLARAPSDLDRCIIEILLAIPDEQREPMSLETSAMLGRIFGMTPLLWKYIETACMQQPRRNEASP
jgi:hypothetical protein